MEQNVKKAWVTTVVAMSCLMIAGAAFGSTSLNVDATSFGGVIYDYGINKILQGAIGTTIGVGCMVWAAIKAVQGAWMPAVGSVLGGVGFLKADQMVASINSSIF